MMTSSWPTALAALTIAIAIAILSQGGVLAFQAAHQSFAASCSSSRCSSPLHRLLASDSDASTDKSDDDVGPDILQPFVPAMDPKYSVTGPVGEGKFIISRTGPPTAEEMSNEQMLKIVKIECNDLEVNTLVWKCLGYRFNEEEEKWEPTEVFPNWKERFPDPPDFIGMQRVYSREVDQPSLRSNQALVRSIPPGNKQSLKTQLKPIGWKGYNYKELTPNKTRRAQCANWIVFFREELFGYTVEELKERRRLRKEAEAAAEAKMREEGKEVDTWKPPVKEVCLLSFPCRLLNYGAVVCGEERKWDAKRRSDQREQRIAWPYLARKCNVIVRNCHTAANLTPPNHAQLTLVKRTSNCRGMQWVEQ
eukprot:scaffold15984_cov127-Skeletonema_dohrnii-CCMP3373.AAC.4